MPRALLKQALNGAPLCGGPIAEELHEVRLTLSENFGEAHLPMASLAVEARCGIALPPEWPVDAEIRAGRLMRLFQNFEASSS